MYATTEINQLDRKTLLCLVWQYNSYVIEVCDRNDGSSPVCLSEYFNNEFYYE